MAAEERTIIGFVHVYMVNHWKDILVEQISLMRISGLYDRVKNIYVGCIGAPEQLEILRRIVNPYPKIIVALYGSNARMYEFMTLALLKQKADILSQHYGFYIHSKGVSYPGNEGGKYWRDYMNYYNITRWKDAVEKLDFGYDTCGVKLVNKIYPLHYSGNFFWYNSEYVKVLPDLVKIDRTDRFKAEMWICMGQPICATLCQDFVDYNTTGIFKP